MHILEIQITFFKIALLCIGFLILGAVAGIAIWQFVRRNNKPIADKADNITNKVGNL